jgi:nucleoside-diphosphate-sugar epimerase
MGRDQLFAQPDFIPQFSQFEQFAGLRVGMTGHRGVLGSILSARMLAHGVKVDRYPGDVTDGETLSAWFSDLAFDLFFHCAAIVPVLKVEREPFRAFEVNVLGTYETCKRLVQRQDDCWFFMPSTSHVYQPVEAYAWRPLKVGDVEAPSSVYGRTKLAAEHLCRQLMETCHHPHCIGRIFSFSHRSQQEPYLVPSLIRRIRELGHQEKLRLLNPDALRDILDAETVVDAILYLALRRSQGTVNIGSGKPLSIAEIATRIATLLERKLVIESEPMGVADALVADVGPLRAIIESGESNE